MNYDSLYHAIVDIEKTALGFANAYCDYPPARRPTKGKYRYARISYARDKPFYNADGYKGNTHATCVDIWSRSQLTAHQQIESTESANILVEKAKAISDMIMEIPGIGHDKMVVDMSFYFTPKSEPRLDLLIDRLSLHHRTIELRNLMKKMEHKFGLVSDRTPEGPMMRWAVDNFPVFAPTPGSAVSKYFAFNNLDFFDSPKNVIIPDVALLCDKNEVEDEIDTLHAMAVGPQNCAA
jgi:hypothetical protein